MKSKINKLSNTNKAIIGAILLIAITNPWSVGYIGNGVEILIKYFTLYSHYGFIAGFIGLAVVNLYVIATTNKVNIPERGKKTKLSREY